MPPDCRLTTLKAPPNRTISPADNRQGTNQASRAISRRTYSRLHHRIMKNCVSTTHSEPACSHPWQPQLATTVDCHADCISPGYFRFPTSSGLLSDSQTGNQLDIPAGVFRPHVIQQSPTSADHHQQPATARVVFPVTSQMSRQRVDSLCQHGDLHIRRPGVRIGLPELLDQFTLTIFCNRHLVFQLITAETGGMPLGSAPRILNTTPIGGYDTMTGPGCN